MTTATARPALDKSRLLALLNWELAAYSECDGCRFTGIRTLRKPDVTGCNWADARVDADHWLTVNEQLILRQVIDDTRREFDLRPH
jgi:hypothetical protein